MHGYTRDELIGMHSRVFIHPEDHPLFDQYLATIRAGGEFRARARNVRKDGSATFVVVPVEVATSYRPGDPHLSRPVAE
jgi:PAS domain S-box-containing protein